MKYISKIITIVLFLGAMSLVSYLSYKTGYIKARIHNLVEEKLIVETKLKKMDSVWEFKELITRTGSVYISKRVKNQKKEGKEN